MMRINPKVPKNFPLPMKALQNRFIYSSDLLKASLREPTVNYKLLVDYTFDCETFHDKTGRLLYVSPGFERVTGYPPSVYLTGKITLKDLFNKDELQHFMMFFAKAQSGEMFNDVEFCAICRDGHERPISVSNQPVKDTQGNFVGFRMSIRDISERKKVENELRFLSSITEQVSDSIMVTDRRFRIIFINKAAEALFGYSAKELLGQTPDILNAEPMARSIQRDIYRTVGRGKVWVGRHVNRRKDGSTFICEFKVSPILDAQGKIYCYCGVQRDVTSKEAAKKTLEAQRNLGLYLSSTHDLKDALTHILNSALKIEGVDCGGIYLIDNKKQTVDLVVHKGLGPRFIKRVSRFGAADFETKAVLRGKPIYALYSRKFARSDPVKKAEGLTFLAVVPIVFENKTVAVLNVGSHTAKKISREARQSIASFAGTVGGVIARLRLEEEFQRNSYHDSLTNIPNRRLFLKNLNQAMRRARRNPSYRFGILFIDLDRFKDINDGLGHLTGDKVILEVSRKLPACVRANDTIARFGGDEFTILLDDIEGLDAAIDAANRIQLVLSHPISLHGRDFYLSGSIGVLMYSPKYHSPEDMLRDADTAMYKAKLSGKARYAIFDETMHKSAMDKIHLENDLRHAIRNNQLEVHYQPFVSLADGHICGLEALLRWHHPQRGLIPPKDFIPLAEENGMIIPLTEWVMKTVAQQAQRWFAQGFKLNFAINLSSLNLSQRNLPDIIEEDLKTANISPEHLEIEITETAALKEFDLALGTLNRLHSLGGQISIDDFGVGFAPLLYLKQFPVNKIKIDISFIRDVPADPGVVAIVQAMIAMAHVLKIKVIAEGVETPEQLDFLRGQGCDEMQGYLFSRPVNAQTMTEYLQMDKKLF